MRSIWCAASDSGGPVCASECAVRGDGARPSHVELFARSGRPVAALVAARERRGHQRPRARTLAALLDALRVAARRAHQQTHRRDEGARYRRVTTALSLSFSLSLSLSLSLSHAHTQPTTWEESNVSFTRSLPSAQTYCYCSSIIINQVLYDIIFRVKRAQYSTANSTSTWLIPTKKNQEICTYYTTLPIYGL